MQRSALTRHERTRLQTSPRRALPLALAKGLTGDIAVPGDKSMSHRALILGGLAKGETRISGLLEGDDVLHTADAVRALRRKVERIGAGEWRVHGAEWRSPAAPIDCGNSGTGARLLMGAAAGFPISVHLHRRRLAEQPADGAGARAAARRWAREPNGVRFR